MAAPRKRHERRRAHRAHHGTDRAHPHARPRRRVGTRLGRSRPPRRRGDLGRRRSRDRPDLRGDHRRPPGRAGGGHRPSAVGAVGSRPDRPDLRWHPAPARGGARCPGHLPAARRLRGAARSRVGVHAARGGRRRGRARPDPGHGARDAAHRAPGARAAPDAGHDHRGRARGPAALRRRRRPHPGRRRRRARRHAGAALAGPPAAPHRGAPGARSPARHRTARARHLLPDRQGGERGAARSVRRRQDGAAALAGEVVRRAGDRLRRLWRARQRDGASAPGVPRARRPAQRTTPDGAHDPGRQHVEHAGRGARSERLHGHHPGRVLPRPGLRRGPDGRLHLALGGGFARDRRPPRGDAGRGGLPGVPAVAARRLLRARLPSDHALGRGGFGHGHRCGEPTRRRLHRAGHAAHAAVHARLLGARPRAR